MKSKLASVLISLLTLTACVQNNITQQQATDIENPMSGRETQTISFETENGAQEMEIYISKTAEERSQGLMFVEDLPQNHGMLFIFEQMHQPNFWMKNTKIPLDFIYLDDQGKVVEFLENVPPCTQKNDFYCENYFPQELAQYVLEVNAGWVEEVGVEVGDEFDLESLIF